MQERIASIPVVGWVFSLIAAKPLDRLGLLTLLSSLYYFQIWGFMLFDGGSWPANYHVKIALMALCCVGVVLPRLYHVLLINSLVFAAAYMINAPIASNNQTTAFFVSVVLLIGAVVALVQNRGSGESWRDEIFRTISGPGRYLLAIMYFYGIYHKINVDFLDADVSCAVVLYELLAVDIGLENWWLGQQSAIYSTFIIEAIAMILLFSPRYKRIGMLVGIPFHIIIGWTGYAYYKDFSTIVLVMYAMFMPREAFTAAFRDLSDRVGGPVIAAWLGRIALAAVFVGYLLLAGAHRGGAELVPTHEEFVWLFTLYGFVFYAFAVAYTPWHPSQDEAPVVIRPAWLAIIPILFFLNGLSPYLGLKTEASIAMYSNLHTEDGQTNHLLHGQLPIAAGYQNDVVHPISSNAEWFDNTFIGGGLSLVRFEFDRILSLHPDLVVTFRHEGVEKSSAEGWVNSYDNASFIERGFLTFKPIDYARPKVCTH
ncbi:MAG: thiol-disulfide oxidoreductase [Pseudomonadota bacterium]